MSTRIENIASTIVSSPRISSAMDRVLRGGYIGALLISDLLMIGLAFRLAFWMRFNVKITLAPEVIPLSDLYFSLSFAITVGCILLFALVGLYNYQNLLGGTTEYARAFNACTIAILLVVYGTFVFPTFVISRGWLIASWILSILLIFAGRFLLRRAVYKLREKGFFLVTGAILGTGRDSLDLVENLSEPRSGYRIAGLIELNPDQAGKNPASKEGGSSLPVLGNLEALEEPIAQYGIRELIVPGSSLHRKELFELYERVHSLEGVELRIATGLFEMLTTGVQVRTAGVVPLIGPKKMRLDPMELILKTVVEYALTVVGLVALSPLMAVIAAAIKLDSQGPLIYRRRVVGAGGKEFDAFKFRTMRVDGDAILAQRQDLTEKLLSERKLKSDPRVTRLGHWLRRWSLDELPQLFNVLLGQMSLVGPRMISPPEAEKYGRNKYNLHSVKPGLTGLWQVSGRSDLSYEERVRLDMYYIRNYTIWLDFHILFIRTAGAVLKARGAY